MVFLPLLKTGAKEALFLFTAFLTALSCLEPRKTMTFYRILKRWEKIGKGT